MLDDERFLEETVDGKKTKRDNPSTKRGESCEDLYAQDLQIISQSLKAMETEMDDEEGGGDINTAATGLLIGGFHYLLLTDLL